MHTDTHDAGFERAEVEIVLKISFDWALNRPSATN